MIPDLSPPEALKALKRHGYDAVCWRVADVDPTRKSEVPSFWGNNLCTLELKNIEAEASALAPLAQAAGLPAASLTTYLNLQDLDLKLLEKVFKAAQTLGAKQVRVNAPVYDGKTHARKLMDLGRPRLAEAAALAGIYGRQIVIETHMNLLSCSPSLTMELLEGCDPAQVGVIYDPANMVVEGMEDARMTVDLLGDYLAAVHVKNVGWYPKAEGGWHFEWIPISTGIVDWKATMQLLRDRKYDGLVSFEDFSKLSTPEKLANNLPYIKNFLVS
jgi:sugar phosphate isomerase/epimerase